MQKQNRSLIFFVIGLIVLLAIIVTISTIVFTNKRNSTAPEVEIEEPTNSIGHVSIINHLIYIGYGDFF